MAKAMRSPYHRPWPLPPAVGRAIKDHYHPISRVQDDLNRWFLKWFVLCVSLIVVVNIVVALAAAGAA